MSSDLYDFSLDSDSDFSYDSYNKQLPVQKTAVN